MGSRREASAALEDRPTGPLRTAPPPTWNGCSAKRFPGRQAPTNHGPTLGGRPRQPRPTGREPITQTVNGDDMKDTTLHDETDGGMGVSRSALLRWILALLDPPVGQV